MSLGVDHSWLRTISGDHTLSLKEQSQTALLTVTDAGTGILEDALLHLFEEFDRAANAKAHMKPGTGLGLAIRKNIVSATAARGGSAVS